MARYPRFSVVIPAYNAENFISDALNSVGEQAFLDYEIVVVDDGSVDATVKEVEDWIRKHPTIASTLMKSGHKGISEARNIGIQKAKGEYICFLDADDIWAQTKLQAVAKCLDIQGAFDVVCHDEWSENHGLIKGRLTHGPYKTFEDLLLKGNSLSTSAVAVRRARILAVGGFDVKLQSGLEDYDLWLRLARSGCSFEYLHEVLGESRSFGQGITSKIEAHCEEGLKVLSAHFSSLGSKTSFYRYLLRRRRAAFLRWAFRELMRLGRFQQAQIYWRKSIKEDPLSWKTYLVAILSMKYLLRRRGVSRRFVRGNTSSVELNLPSIEAKQLLMGIYTTRCAGGDGEGLDQILPPDRTHFFGYGRQALAEAIRLAGVRPGDEVLLPGFLCADVMASLSVTGAIPRFYDVDKMLNVDMASFEKAATKSVCAMVVVNYFGFPQPLESIKSWCQSHDVALIEDNAHGFLSAEGQAWLGRRGDFGVFSLRKTFALPNGAALVDNRPGKIHHDGMPSIALSQADYWQYRSKSMLKRIMKWGNLGSAKAIVAGIRVVKRIPNGRSTPAWGADVETVLPHGAFGSLAALLLRRCDFSAERRRRRLLYGICDQLLAGDSTCRAVFPVLPEEVVPYGYPFYFNGSDATGFQKQLFAKGLMSFIWPDRLPNTDASVPRHYRQLMCISFLW